MNGPTNFAIGNNSTQDPFYARSSQGAMRTQCHYLVRLKGAHAFKMVREVRLPNVKIRFLAKNDEDAHVRPDSSAHIESHVLYNAYLAQQMPEIIVWPNMAEQCLQQEWMELTTAMNERAPEQAAAPRGLSFWILLRHIPKSNERLCDQYRVHHILNGFVHMMASDVGYSCMASHIRCMIIAGDDADKVARRHGVFDTFNVAFPGSIYHACALVSWIDSEGSQQSRMEVLDEGRFQMNMLSEPTTTVSSQLFSDGRHPVNHPNSAEWLRETFIRLCLDVEPSNPKLRGVVSQLHLPIDVQPPNALLKHLRRISQRYYERIHPPPVVNDEVLRIHWDVLTQPDQAVRLRPTGHTYNMMPTKAVERVFSTHSIAFHHTGATDMQRFACSTLIDQSVPMFGLCLSNRFDSGREFFDCKRGWHLPASDELPLDQQASAPHLCGLLTRLVSFHSMVSAYASYPSLHTPFTSSMTVIYPVLFPVREDTMKEWLVVPCASDAFAPLDRRHSNQYNALMKTIDKFITDVCQNPFGFDMKQTNADITTYANNHTQSIDNSFLELGMRSNHVVRSLGSAAMHMNCDRGDDARTVARLLQILCRKYGPNTSVDDSMQQLCRELEEWHSYGFTIEEVRHLRLIHKAIT